MVYVIWIPVAVFFIAVVSKIVGSSVRLGLFGRRVMGIVVEYAGDENAFPVVEFIDRYGKLHRRQLTWGGGPAVGQPFALVYDPKNPDNVSDATRVKWICGIAIGFGVFTMGISFIYVIIICIRAIG